MMTKWYWNEDTETVEFHQEKAVRRRKMSLGELRRKRALRRLVIQREQVNAQNSEMGKKAPESFVTLPIIEDVAMRLLASVITIKNDFVVLTESIYFSVFLRACLHYFDCFFLKIQWEASLDQSFIDISPKEKEEIAQLTEKLQKAEKILGHGYLPLILGKGYESLHHMQCGWTQYSSTNRDQHLFESLHSYLCYAIWVANRRVGFEIIQSEIGRLLKTNIFNPYTIERKKIKSETSKLSNEAVKMLPKSSKIVTNHIPKSSHHVNVIRMNSPALSSALFSQLNEIGGIKENQCEEDIYDMFLNRYGVDLRTISAGILGMPLCLFNRMTLTEKRADDDVSRQNTEEDMAVEEGKKFENIHKSISNLSIK